LGWIWIWKCEFLVPVFSHLVVDWLEICCSFGAPLEPSRIHTYSLPVNRHHYQLATSHSLLCYAISSTNLTTTSKTSLNSIVFRNFVPLFCLRIVLFLYPPFRRILRLTYTFFAPCPSRSVFLLCLYFWQRSISLFCTNSPCLPPFVLRASFERPLV